MPTLNIPYFKQPEGAYTCAAVALQMVLAYYGKSATYDETCDACAADEYFGSSIRGLLNAARSYGFQPQCVEIASVSQLEAILRSKRPVIAFVDQHALRCRPRPANVLVGHAVVITGLEDDAVIYHDPDPSKGDKQRRSVSIFWKAWRWSDCKGVVI